MSISPVCNMCGKKLNEFGALVFSPPTKSNVVKKYHICKSCFNKLEKTLQKK